MDRILYLVYPTWRRGGHREKEAAVPPFKDTLTVTCSSRIQKSVRKLAMLCVDEADEWQLHTCRSRSKRLDKLAISNRQVAIQGMPAISDEDGRYIAKTLLAMRGANQKTHKALHEDGQLKLHPRPFAYKGTSHAWMRNLKMRGRLEDWAREPALPDGPARRKNPLDSTTCPECKTAQDTKTHKLQVKVGFCQLQWKQCLNILHQAMAMSVWIGMV